MTRQKKVDPSTLLTPEDATFAKKKKNIKTSDYQNLTDNMMYVKVSEGMYSIQYRNTDSKLQYKREDIMNLIDNKDIKGLRKVSRYFYSHSGLYKRLIQHMSNMLTFDYLVVPAKQTYRKMTDAKFTTYFDKALNFIDDLFIKDTFSKVSELVFMNGAFYGYYRELGNTKAIQELPIDYCRTRAKVDGVYQVQFDVRYFDTFRDVVEKQMVITQFPDEFLDAYLDYKAGTKEGSEPWFFDLSPEFAMCFQYDDLGVPFFVGIFEDLVELEDYKVLEKAKTKMDLKKLVVQKLPLDEKTGEVLLELPDAQALHANLIKMLQNNDYVDGISSPCHIDALNLQDNSSKAQKDSLLTAERTLFNDAGFSQSILNATGNLSLTISIQNDEAIALRLLDFYQRWLCNKLDYVVSTNTYYFDIDFLPVTIYNRGTKLTEYQNLATFGYAKLPYIVASGIKQSSFINMLSLENDFLKLHEKMIPVSSAHTGGLDQGGRPQSDESNLTEAGSKTKNIGGNEGRA